MEPAERYLRDPVFHHLVDVLYREFARCDQGGAGLTPTEVREASSFAWQRYVERHQPALAVFDAGTAPAEETPRG